MLLLLQAILLIIIICFSYFVYLKGYKRPTPTFFALFLGFLSLMFFLTFYNNTYVRNVDISIWLVRTVMVLGTGVTIFFLYFAGYFPNDKLIISKRVLTIFSFLSLIVLADDISPLMFPNVQIVNGDLILHPSGGILIFAAYALTAISVGIWSLIQKYKVSILRDRTLLKIFILMISIVVTIIFTINFIIPVFLGTTQGIIYGQSSMLIFISFIGYSIVRHKLFNIYLAVRRVTIWLLSFAATYVIVYFFALVFLRSYISPPFPLEIDVGLVDLVLLILIPGIIKYMSIFADSILFKRAAYQDNAIKDFYNILNKTINIEDLLHETKNHIKEIFGLKSIEILRNNVDDPEIFNMVARYPTLSTISTDEQISEEDKSLLLLKGISVIFTLVTKDQSTKFIFVLYDKISNEPFYVEDDKILQDIIGRITLSVENAALYDQVLAFNKTLQARIEEATNELKEKNDELQRAYEEANETARKERDMLDIMGHELRTPATVVKMATYLLDPQVSTENGKKQIERIKDSIERQIKLINTFINTAKIENNKIELSLTPVHLDEMLRQAVEDHTNEAIDKGLQLYYEDNGQMPFVLADRARIREVIDNLITNAIKYTFEGYVKAWCFIGDREVVVKVEDSGEGIKEEDKQELFQKFKRVNNYTASSGGTTLKMIRPGGTGLGLYVCKGVIELHRGRIWVDSEYGKGSTFGFAIPLASEEEIQKYIEQPGDSANMFAKYRLSNESQN